MIEKNECIAIQISVFGLCMLAFVMLLLFFETKENKVHVAVKNHEIYVEELDCETENLTYVEEEPIYFPQPEDVTLLHNLFDPKSF